MNGESIFGWLDNTKDPEKKPDEEQQPGDPGEEPDEAKPEGDKDPDPNDPDKNDGGSESDDKEEGDGSREGDKDMPMPPPKPDFNEEAIIKESDFGWKGEIGKTSYYFFDRFRNFLHFRYAVSRYCNWLMKREHNRNYFRDFLFSERTVKSQIRSGTWYGPGTEYEELINFRYKFFQAPELIDEVYHKIRAEIPKTLISEIPQAKLVYSESRGIFVFDRAAMGLKKVYRYRNIENDLIIPRYEVVEISPGVYETKDGDPVEREEKKLRNGLPAAGSSIKKGFGYFDKKKKRIQAVCIYSILSIAANVPAQELIYAGIATAVLARILLEKGYKVEINSVVGVFTGEATIFDIIPAKRFNTTLDISQVAFVLSDPRFFRWDGFMGLVSGWDQIGRDTPYGIGSPVSLWYFKDVAEAFKEKYFEMKYPNTLMAFMGGQTNARSAADSVTATIQELIKKTRGNG